jgi:hypothetical protein
VTRDLFLVLNKFSISGRGMASRRNVNVTNRRLPSLSKVKLTTVSSSRSTILKLRTDPVVDRRSRQPDRFSDKLKSPMICPPLSNFAYGWLWPDELKEISRLVKTKGM